MSKVIKSMESARITAQGTMPMNVLFETDGEVEEAIAWKKGKQKVKNLFPMTFEASARIREKRIKEVHTRTTRGMSGQKK